MKMSEVPSRVHFVGVGGVGQSGLAKHLVRLGKNVSGSDLQQSQALVDLQQSGIAVSVGHFADNIGNAELVVRTSAVGNDNVEVDEARRRGISVVLREELLGAIFNQYPVRIAVCGTHGKTTVTAMISHILHKCGVEHAAFIGGYYHGQNYCFGNNVVVAEACEYNRSFLQLHPTVTVCLNCEFDHPDCYKNSAEVRSAFGMLADQTSLSFVCPQDLADLSERSVVFGTGGISAENIRLCCGKPTFDLFRDGKFVHCCKMNVVGDHNVNNALAALTAADIVDVPLLQATQAICSFDGVDRRWTEKQSFCKIAVDYAHHPTEISSAIKCAQSLSKHTLCVFQPHTFSRTKAFFTQFAECFRGVSVVYLPIYAAREAPQVGVTSKALTEYAKSIGVDAVYANDFNQAESIVRTRATADTIVLILGAGNVVQLVDRF